jgi:type IX secretion system PorP/SprF family membrane protein
MKIFYWVLFAGLLLMLPKISFAQLDVQYSQFMWDPYAYNPAYAGLDDALSGTIHVRSQWTGLDGAPVTEGITLHTPLPAWKSGVGFEILNDEQGLLRNTSVSLGYAYDISVGKGVLAIGVEGSLIQASLDGSQITTPGGTSQDSIYNSNDNILPSTMVNALGGDASAGIYLLFPKFKIGVSVDHLVGNGINFKSAGTEGGLKEDFPKQIFATASYKIAAGDNLVIEPSVFFKSTTSTWQAEANATVTYKNIISAGAGYRGFTTNSQDAVYGILGVHLNNGLFIGYSYDYTLSALNEVSNGTHELLINYKIQLFKPARPGKIIYTPRF